ncbi:MAG: hypothetical protein KDE27_00275 [Planctomycetes bacterium]|nr:hypothetical protein [Planctomycetota bacterium]
MPTRPLAILAGAILAAAVAVAFAACGERTPSAPPAATSADVILTIDGIDITLGELEPFMAWIRETRPDVGRKTLAQKVLEGHLVPLRLAERAFAAERAAQRAKAVEIRSVVQNVYELERASDALEVQDRRRYTRLQPDLSVGMFLFDRLQEGNVSDPIAVPRGFVLASTHEHVDAPVAGEDMVEATQVGFFTHKVGEFHDWIEQEQARVADKVTYVHPDYRDALPTWCQPPKPEKK